ncbi:hypothetical protein CPB83DRAFT_896331 [Crepidotus variabilis]|uniref:TPR-like protein n=1 Tax=Crepidotus variabilis TaxID=179855 RepID=A0A9P6EBY7_9AGAR|nr:hypothetical protein CPB83DRAFT_896331 [Crepidotus variabilis]
MLTDEEENPRVRWDEDYGSTPNESGDDEDSEESSQESDEQENEEPLILDQEDAEKEIEGDFERLVKKIRLQDDSSTSSNLLAKDWDFNVEEKDAEFKDDLRAASGVGKRRSRRPGRKSGPTLSQQVKSIIGEGNQAYIDGNVQQALSLMREVIRIEPRAADGWSVIAQCYDDLKDAQKALQARIMAAHLRHDAEEWERLARQSRDLGYSQQALYCYRKVCSLDPANVNAFWDRAVLAKEIGAFKTAKNAYMAILKRFPNDFTLLRELHTILVELGELDICANLLQEALDTQMINPYSGEDGTKAGRMDLLLLADLHNALGDHGRAVQVIRRGTRWFQGRMDQRYWDMCDDDREYDQDGWPGRPNTAEGAQMPPGNYVLDTNARHRLAVARIKMGDNDEGQLHARAVLSEDVLDYSVLFAEIADAYFDKEMYSEAKPIYELLGGDPATSSIYILMQTAACMRNVDDLKDAAEVYEHIRLADPSNTDAKMKLAEIYEIINEPRKALDLVYEVIDARKRPRRPNGTVNTPNSSVQPESPTTSFFPTTSLFTEEKPVPKKQSTAAKQNRLTHQQLKELEVQKEKDVMRGHRRLQELWNPMLASEEDAHREWMLEAEKLVDMFRETRNLFLTSRSNPFRGMFPRNRMRKRQGTEADEDQMASRLQLDLERDTLARKSVRSGDMSGAVDVFRGVSFNDWLRLFMQYCFNLTANGEHEAADEILRHIMVSNAYQSRERQDTIRLALISCAMHADNQPIVVENCRKLITTHQFNNEPLRILLASLASGLKNTDSFITSTLQKHLFREMKMSDLAVKNPAALRWNNVTKRYAAEATSGTAKKGKSKGEDSDEEEEEDGADTVQGSGSANGPPLPTKPNPIIVAIYGQVCIAAKSYQSAIFYLLHAYDYYPEDPMICLCLAIASIGRAMQRQSDNRHHLIVQAMAFLTKYREIRTTLSPNSETAPEIREIEYNYGRIFHQLGLYSQAVKHYEKVLELAEQAKDDMYAKETAYNLSMIFVFTGANLLADALYRRWLSI